MKPKSHVKLRSKSPRRVAPRAGVRQRDAAKIAAPEFANRDDLPFIARDAHECMIHWQPARQFPAADDARSAGMAYAETVARLADVDEYEAYCAIKHALLSPDWKHDGGEEYGFVDSLVRSAIIGMRAQASKEALPFETRFDPEHSLWCSLLEQVDVMKAQIKAMNVKPWRTYAQAGLG